MDNDQLLTNGQKDFLEKRFERIDKEVSLDFIVVIGSEVDSRQPSSNQVRIYIDPSMNVGHISLGDKVENEIEASLINGIETEYLKSNLNAKNYFKAIDVSMNHITDLWITKYYNEKEENISGQIVLWFLLILFCLLIMFFTKSIRPLAEKGYSEIKKQNRLSQNRKENNLF